jgi:DmsE family decaheme c-type cytochrome
MKRQIEVFAVLAKGLFASFVMGAVLNGAWAQEPEKAPPQGKDLVLRGDAKCTLCHNDPQILSIGQTRHGVTSDPRTPTCTSCHGESESHRSGPAAAKPDRYFAKNSTTPADVRSGACLECHGGDRHLAFWESGRHKKNDVACNNCHQIHAAKAAPQLRKDNPSITPFVTTSRQLQYETCTACHKQIRSQLLKTSHHPILEGKLNCTNCHNPHGALSHAMIRDESVNQLCTSCHADKRGPFMQEHPPVEENCLTCHNSHGSMHTKLLVDRPPTLCQSCHDASRHPGTFYSGNQGFDSGASGAPNTRLIARGCVNCHTSIHGSNAPAMRGKFFLR